MDLISGFIDYMQSIRSVSPQTVKAYRHDLKQFALFCEDAGVMPENAEFHMVERFIADLSFSGLAAVSVNRALSTLRGFFGWLIRFGRRKDDPCALIKNLKTPKKLPVFLWEDEMADFAKTPENFGLLWEKRDSALILLLYSSGMRISEAMSLTLSSLKTDYSGARIIGKGAKERVVFFSDECRAALCAYLPEREALLKETGGKSPVKTVLEKRLFLNKRGAALSPAGARWIISRYSSFSSVKKNVHPHALRHTFATNLLKNGCDIRLVQELLGHANISTTARYTHLNIEGLKETYRKAHPHA
ncbi:MAG: tyrosine-type recombinase/integrase [Spirochaetaceae bacterium]|nr:tyrosine-type recombinase/integrase [Spirochaetaceae bacterium]